MALFKFRLPKSEAQVKGLNGSAVVDLDAFYSGESDKLKNVDILTSLTEISTRIARMKFQVKTKDESKKLAQHGVLHLLNERPNKWETPYNFKLKIISESILYGNAYIHILRDENGVPVELRRLNHDQVVVRKYGNKNDDSYIDDVDFKIEDKKGNQIKIVDNKDMIHLKPFNFDGITGLSLIDSMIDDLDISRGTKDLVAEFIKNKAFPGGILNVGSEGLSLTEEQKRYLRDDFERVNKSNFGRVILSDDSQNFTPNESISEMMEKLMNFDVSSQKFAQLFGLPLHKFGKSTSNMSLTQINKEFELNTLGIYVEMLESEFNSKLLTEEEIKDFRLSVVKDDIASLDVETKRELVSTLERIGGITANEAREIIGLEKVDNEHLDVFRVSLNTINAEIINDYQTGTRGDVRDVD